MVSTNISYYYLGDFKVPEYDNWPDWPGYKQNSVKVSKRRYEENAWNQGILSFYLISP